MVANRNDPSLSACRRVYISLENNNASSLNLRPLFKHWHTATTPPSKGAMNYTCSFYITSVINATATDHRFWLFIYFYSSRHYFFFGGGGGNPDVVRMEYSDVGSPPLFPSVLFFCFDVESNSNRSSSSSHLGCWDLYLRLLGALYLFLNFSHTKTLLMCQKILSWPLEK